MEKNVDVRTVEGFGQEWSAYDQSSLSPAEAEAVFQQYFATFPWQRLPRDAVGFDLGCGSGRWAKMVAPRVGILHCVDASERAIDIARKNLADLPACRFHCASVDRLPLSDDSMDFGYCLGVLHHVPDTMAGMRSCVRKLKPGAPFLLYLYYAFDNRPRWFRGLWKISDYTRTLLCRLPLGLKVPITSLIAALVYYPMARGALLIEKMGGRVDTLPLSVYRTRSFYTMRTDALDRFGTCLEQRFTADQIRDMMHNAGLDQIAFATSPPFWCAVGYKRTV